MKRIYIILGIILLILFSNSVLAQSYNKMTRNELAKLYHESCEANQPANCYQFAIRIKAEMNANPPSTYIKNICEEKKLNFSGCYKSYLEKACVGGEKNACSEQEGKQGLPGSRILYFAALGLIGLAVFLITKTIFQDEDQYQAQEKLEENKSENLGNVGFVLKYSKPFFRRYFTPVVSSMKNKKAFKETYKRPSSSCRIDKYINARRFFCF